MRGKSKDDNYPSPLDLLNFQSIRSMIDSLLADDDGQDMEQEVIRTQHPEQNGAQVFEVDGALPPPAVDILSAAVDDIMVEGDMQNQKQDNLEP